VCSAQRAKLNSGDHVMFLAATTYRQDLSGLLAREGYACEAPLQGLRIGEQLQWPTRELS
jgi:hypothetical protein